MSSVRYLIDKVTTRLRMEGGLATQIYSEDAIVMGIQHKFTALFDELWWPQFMVYQEAYTLDGITGLITADISSKVRLFSDLKAVHLGANSSPLPRAPDSTRIAAISSPCVQPYADKTKVFRIIPPNYTGQIAITYRKRPEQFDNENDEVDMDEQLIILGTCYDMLEDDSLNPGASDKFKQMFDMRFRQLVKNQHNMAMQSDTTTGFGWGSMIAQPIQLLPDPVAFEELVGEY